LVLMHNTQIEKSLNKKMCARYIGPLIVVSHNYGSAYILSELDGTVLHRPIAAFFYSPISPVNLFPFPQISLTSTTLAFKKWNSVCMQMETKKIPTTTPQTISPNKPVLSLSIYFPLSFYHFPLSDISPFIPKTQYGLTLRHIRPLLYRSQGYDDNWALLSSSDLIFSLLYYKDKDILEKASKR
jgi:hypothetical protein